MLAINLEPELERHLASLAERNGQTLDNLLHRAVERLIEDLEDLAAVEAAMKDYDPANNVSLEEVRRELGLED